jgi:hypothetical protein
MGDALGLVVVLKHSESVCDGLMDGEGQLEAFTQR